LGAVGAKARSESVELMCESKDSSRFWRYRVRLARQVGDEQAASACSGKHSAAGFES
jgi:hypothetical protein